MALATYLSAPWALDTIATRPWRLWPVLLAALAAWASVDGVYRALHWSLAGLPSLADGRAYQWPASLCLCVLAGLIWRRLR